MSPHGLLVDPLATCRRLLAERRRATAAWQRQADRLSDARLVTFAAGALIAGAAAFGGWLSAWWLGLPVGLFAALVVRHDRVLLAEARAARAVAWYEHGIARIEDRWPGLGPAGDRFADAEHLYAQDLDLFGDGSLFQLLCTARTQAGEETLAAWLKSPAGPAEVAARQAAVRELQPRVALREEINVAAEDMRTAVRPARLAAWAAGEGQLQAVWPRFAAVGFTALIGAALLAWLQGAITLGPLLAALVAASVFRYRFHARTTRIMHGADEPSRELLVLGQVCRVLRGESYRTARLQALHAALAAPDGEAYDAARRLRRAVERHDWQHNIMFLPFAALLFWDLHCAFAVEAWRRRHGPRVADWLRDTGEFEALAALGTYAWEHPADPFPEIADRAGPAVYEAERLSHPLLPAAAAVPNDVALGPAPRVLIVSGSNMSGKTTLLRSVGINAVLALMGAPVRAARLRLSPLTPGATLRIEDSLQAGRSRFYAEVLRLGQIVAAARAGPTLFLLDELFHGTNSHDRRDGARGLLGSLLELPTLGLVTTHDLALAGIADGLAPAGRNAHFDDHLVDGEMHFDYRLKPGPVTRSNALAIMRAVGLDVPEADGAPERPGAMMSGRRAPAVPRGGHTSEAVPVRRVRDGPREVDVLDD